MNLDLPSFTSAEVVRFNRLAVEERTLLQTWISGRIAFLKERAIIRIAITSLDPPRRTANALIIGNLLTIKNLVDYGPDKVSCFRTWGPKPQ